MIYEHFVSGGWIGFDTAYIEKRGRKLPFLWIGIKDKENKGMIKRTGVPLIHKNTEILPDLYRAIGHYLGHRNDDSDNKQPSAYFQHEQETYTR